MVSGLVRKRESGDTVIKVFEINRNRRKKRGEGEGAGMGTEK